MTSISAAAPTGTRTASEQQFTGIETQQLVGCPTNLVETLSDMPDHEVTEFLITCAQAVNEAAKRNDLEAVHCLVHAEAQALIELNCRHGAAHA